MKWYIALVTAASSEFRFSFPDFPGLAVQHRDFWEGLDLAHRALRNRLDNMLLNNVLPPIARTVEQLRPALADRLAEPRTVPLLVAVEPRLGLAQLDPGTDTTRNRSGGGRVVTLPRSWAPEPRRPSLAGGRGPGRIDVYRGLKRSALWYFDRPAPRRSNPAAACTP